MMNCKWVLLIILGCLLTLKYVDTLDHERCLSLGNTVYECEVLDR